MPDYSDILAQISDNTSMISDDETLSNYQKLIISKLDDITVRVSSISQSAASDAYGREDPERVFRDRYRNRNRDDSDDRNTRSIFGNRGRRGRSWTEGPELGAGFFDNFEEELIRGLVGSDFRDRIQGVFQRFADQLGVNISDIPGKLGQYAGRYLMNRFRNTAVGKSLTESVGNLFNQGLEALAGRGSSIISNLMGGAGEAAGGAASAAANAAGSAANAAANAASGLGQAIGGPIGSVLSGVGEAGVAASEGLAAAGGASIAFEGLLGPVGIALIAVQLALKAFAPAIEAFMKHMENLGNAANRDMLSAKNRRERAQKRLEADVKSMAEYPFKVLEDAANELYQSWNNNLRTINQTQGYTTYNTMELMSSLAQRLRNEGLSDVIAGTSLVDALTKVLQSGLSGAIAEEFAYQATVLNSAIPTQDFFQFASTYASVAANAIQAGKSQTEAIQEANDSLYSLMNNVLYAGRELVGGINTGLQDANTLYQQAVKIAQAAKSENTNEIAGAISAVSAVVGSVAPDLVTNLTDAIYKMATGGNSSEIVALRSLWGGNASNTDFIRAFANDPQYVLSQIFRNLGSMYTQSSDAYMEKAEGYSQLFGLSSEAFQRVDFQHLADAVSSMNTDSTAILENLVLLKSGQSTASAEQQKANQINKYMIEEGLAYTIDNSVAQMIQQHMWEEQMLNELMETEYGVELVGSSKELLAGMAESVLNILNFFNPFAWFKKLENAITASAEAAAQQADLVNLLKAGKVGEGQLQDLYNLATRDKDLNLTGSAIELFGKRSIYQTIKTGREKITFSDWMSGSDFWNNTGEFRYGANLGTNDIAGTPRSVYSGFGRISKGAADFAQSTLTSYTSSVASIQEANNQLVSNSEQAASGVRNAIETMLEASYIDKYVQSGKSYEEWAASSANYGISDFSAALEGAGYRESDVRSMYENKTTEAGWMESQRLRELEERMYEESHTFWTEDFWTRYNDPLQISLTSIITNQEALQQSFDKYAENFDIYVEFVRSYAGWWQKDIYELYQDRREIWDKRWQEYRDRYLLDKIYGGDTLRLDALEAVQAKENNEKGDVANALSEYLTQNSWSLEDLQNPQIQTNALLSQILIVLNAIMNQQNNVIDTDNGNVSLGDTLSTLAMGLLGKTG